MAEDTNTPVAGDAAAPVVTPAPTTPPAAPAAPNDYVDMKMQNFHFKKEKDVLAVDENGKVKKDDKGNDVVMEVGKKHPTVAMYLPVPKTARLIEILSDPAKFPKENELIQSAIYDVVYSVARGQINEFRDAETNKGKTVTQAVLNLDKLDFTAIANTPRAERGAYAPSDEELKAFLDSYLKVMPVLAGKKEEVIKNHLVLFQGGFKKQKAQKDILELMAGMVAIYLSTGPADEVEENLQVAEYFVNKLDRWLKAEETITMADL